MFYYIAIYVFTIFTILLWNLYYFAIKSLIFCIENFTILLRGFFKTLLWNLYYFGMIFKNYTAIKSLLLSFGMFFVIKSYVLYDPLKVGILISPDKKGHHKSSQKSLKRGKLFSQTLHSILIKYRIFGLKNELTPFYNQWGRLEWHGVQHI